MWIYEKIFPIQTKMPTHSSPLVHPDTAGITEKKHLNLLARTARSMAPT